MSAVISTVLQFTHQFLLSRIHSFTITALVQGSELDLPLGSSFYSFPFQAFGLWIGVFLRKQCSQLTLEARGEETPEAGGPSQQTPRARSAADQPELLLGLWVALTHLCQSLLMGRDLKVKRIRERLSAPVSCGLFIDLFCLNPPYSL